MVKRSSLLASAIASASALLLVGCTDNNAADQSSSGTASKVTESTASGSSGSSSSELSGDQTSESTDPASDSGGSDCYVELFDAENFDEGDDHFRLTKPGRYPDLKNLPGADQDWTDEADSIRVGSAANVTIWKDKDFTGTESRLDPGSEHAKVDPEPSSLELSC